MGKILGSLMLPTVQRTSQLVNDTRFSSIREYVLNAESLQDAFSVEISDLALDSVIYRIDLIVSNPFYNLDGSETEISVKDEENNILLDTAWSDPSSIGTYTTNCYAIINETNQKLTITHNFKNISSGTAILRLHMYTNIDRYMHLLTSDNLYYRTMDVIGVDVKV